MRVGRLLGGSREGKGPEAAERGPTGGGVLPWSPMDLWGLSDGPHEPVGLTDLVTNVVSAEGFSCQGPLP